LCTPSPAALCAAAAALRAALSAAVALLHWHSLNALLLLYYTQTHLLHYCYCSYCCYCYCCCQTKKLADRKLQIIAAIASEAGRRAIKETKLTTLKQKTEALQREADKTAADCGAAADIQAQIEALVAEREEHDTREAQLHNSNRAASNAVRNADRDLNAAKADRHAMQDNSRFKKSRQGPEILRIRAWIQANRGLFREGVYGPMVTEVRQLLLAGFLRAVCFE
jgi:hypothetical protein